MPDDEILIEELRLTRGQVMNNEGLYDSFTIHYLVSNVPVQEVHQWVKEVRRTEVITSDHRALRAVWTASEPKLFGCKRERIYIEEMVDLSTFKIAISYKYDGSPIKNVDLDDNIGDRSISFSGSNVSFHITHSIRTVDRISARQGGGDPPDYRQAINVDENNVINGTDIISPAMSWTEDHKFTWHRFNADRVRELTAMIGTVNGGKFRGFDKGEVLFEGFDAHKEGSKRDTNYLVTFRFAFRANQEDVEVAGTRIPHVEGWQKYWVANRSEERDGKITVAPVSVNVEQVYRYSDFQRLGINSLPWDKIMRE